MPAVVPATSSVTGKVSRASARRIAARPAGPDRPTSSAPTRQDLRDVGRLAAHAQHDGVARLARAPAWSTGSVATTSSVCRRRAGAGAAAVEVVVVRRLGRAGGRGRRR